MESHVSPWVLLVTAYLVAFGLAIWAVRATRKLEKREISTSQSFTELVVSSLDNFVVNIVGPTGSNYTPFIGTLFLYIFAMNLIGLTPLFDSPTANLGITFSLALIVFVMYNYWGVKAIGGKNYLKHLMGEPWQLFPLMLPIHIIGDLVRPVSLSFRLFGNIFGKEIVLGMLAGFSIVIIPWFVAIPLQFPIMVFGVLVSFIQAFVFSLLASVYIALAIGGLEEH